MISKFLQQARHITGGSQFLLALAPHLPRMVAATAVAMFAAFVAIQFMPQKYEANLTLRLPSGSQASGEAEKLIDPRHLGDVVARLSPDIIAELRGEGGGVLDTTALLSKRLRLVRADNGVDLKLAAMAGTPARARAIVTAIAENYWTLSELPPVLPQPKAENSAAVEPSTLPATIPLDDEATLQLQKRLSLAWEDRIKLENRAQRVQSLVADGNYAMLALDAENLPGLGRQIDELAMLEVERSKLAVDLLPNHPRMRVLQEEIDQLSANLDAGMQQLVSLVIADRDAARRLEDGLRQELIAATTPSIVDTNVVTGAISDRPEASVTALPRPIRTDLVLALSGGFAFFGQIGLFAFLRARQQRTDQIDEPDLATEPQDIRAYAPVDDLKPDEPAAPAHNWLDASSMPDTPVDAAWLLEPDEAGPAPEEAMMPIPQETIADSLNAARIVAVRCRGDIGASRRLLVQFAQQGKRVVLVDAASRRRGSAPGISDLSQDLASFADIVHGSGVREAALVPWGRQAQLDPAARSVRILVQALGELYDVVVLALDSDNLSACGPLAAMADLALDAADIPGPAKAAA